MKKKHPASEVAMLLRLLSDWSNHQAGRGGMSEKDPRQLGRNETFFEFRNMLGRLYLDRTGENIHYGPDCSQCGNVALEDYEAERLENQFKDRADSKLAKIEKEVTRQMTVLKEGGVIEDSLKILTAILTGDD